LLVLLYSFCNDCPADNVQEKHDIPGSRGEANFVWKCKLCGVRTSLLVQLNTEI
jgi:hypothetical protein